MLSTRLLHWVEQHWETIADAVVEQMRTDPNTPHHQTLDDDEVRSRSRDLVQHLGLWLTAGDHSELGRHCQEVGRVRQSEGEPLAEVVYKLLLIERKTADYIQMENVAQNSVDLYSELEMIRALDRFFAIVLHNVVAGYERAATGTSAAAWARMSAA